MKSQKVMTNKTIRERERESAGCSQTNPFFNEYYKIVDIVRLSRARIAWQNKKCREAWKYKPDAHGSIDSQAIAKIEKVDICRPTGTFEAFKKQEKK